MVRFECCCSSGIAIEYGAMIAVVQSSQHADECTVVAESPNVVGKVEKK